MKRKISFVLCALLLFTIMTPTSSVAAKKESEITLTVFAASSLAQVFTAIGHNFEIKNPGVRVQFSFLASSTLATQLRAGAPADVFASASIADLDPVKDLMENSRVFTANRVVLATLRTNRFHINKVIDLNKRGLRWIQCAHVVPCGAAADAALASEGRITSKPVSLEPKVASVVAKLVNGEVDAAIIYHTDYIANRSTLKEVRFASAQAATTQYPIGVVKASAKSALARKFVEMVFSAYGRKTLAEAGFLRVS